MALSNGSGMVKSLRIGQSNAAKSLQRRETFNDYNPDRKVLYSLVPY